MPDLALPRRNELATIDNHTRERLAALREEITAREHQQKQLRERMGAKPTKVQRQILAAGEAVIGDLMAQLHAPGYPEELTH